MISQLLNYPFLLLLGEFSFTFYMIHMLVMDVFNACVRHFHLNISWGILLPLYFISITVLSYCVYKYYEKPIASKLKKRL